MYCLGLRSKKHSIFHNLISNVESLVSAGGGRRRGWQEYSCVEKDQLRFEILLAQETFQVSPGRGFRLGLAPTSWTFFSHCGKPPGDLKARNFDFVKCLVKLHNFVSL